jgi:hypothetical protein
MSVNRLDSDNSRFRFPLEEFYLQLLLEYKEVLTKLSQLVELLTPLLHLFLQTTQKWK